MSEQTYVVVPARSDGAQQNPDEVASAIQKSLNNQLHPAGHQGEGQGQRDGPLKKVIANQDSLYKYISWEDPVRTLGSYLGLLGLLCGLHYLHPTQLILKIGATGLGAVSIASLISQSTKSDFVARLRPEYKQVPEPTLNATLRDVHDLVQYSLIQAQKIIYGEDLGKTFGAFLSFTALFWLVKFISPFGLAILGLHLLYIAPLIASPRGREVAYDAKIRAQELANATAHDAKALAQDGKAKVADLSSSAQQTAGNLASRAQQTAANTQQHIGNVAQNGRQTAADTYSQGKNAAADTYSQGKSAAADTYGQGKSAAADTYGQGKSAAADTYGQSKSAANDALGATAENARTLRNVGANTYNGASDAAHSSLDNSQQYANKDRFIDAGEYRDSNRYTNGAQPTKVVYPNVTVDGTVPRYDQTRT